MKWEILKSIPCADQTTISCEVEFSGTSRKDLSEVLVSIGFKIVNLPTRGVTMGTRNRIQIAVFDNDLLTLSRLATEQAARLLLEEITDRIMAGNRT